jgi:pyruvate/2-oxoglutarate dehydrogenase complex dihydrolipoamide acyltransferase (E2) component
MTEPARTRVLQLVLGALLLLTITSAAHTSLLSKTPAAIEPALDDLSAPGLRLEPQGRSESVRERHHALSSTYRWAANPTSSDQPGFKLEAVVVHGRTSSGMDMASLAATAGLPAAATEEQKPESAAEKAKGGDELVLGTAGEESVLRTCISPKGRALASSLKTSLAQERETGAKARMLQALGVQDNIRWECLLVSISAPKSMSSEADLMMTWERLQQPLRGWKNRYSVVLAYPNLSL